MLLRPENKGPLRAAITGVHGYLPDYVMTNDELSTMVETSDQWIVERTGIKERRVLKGEGKGTSHMAVEAVRGLLEKTGTRPDEIDVLVCATITPDMILPSTANLICSELGMRHIGSFDVQAACSGFIYGLDVASQFVETGRAKKAILVGADKMSSILDYTDRTTCVLFGDGAGAVVLRPSAEPGVMSTHLHSDGEYKDLLYVESGVSRGFAIDPATNKVDISIKMAGSEVFKVAVTKLGAAVDEALAANGLEKSAVSWLIPHQANIRIIGAMAKRLELPMEKVILTVQDHGNTSAASVPLALDTGVRDGRIKRGDLLLLEAFGGGFTWGSALVRF
jgi:3-oxoacyl-[acyl-carrier-protein] synthase-3